MRTQDKASESLAAALALLDALYGYARALTRNPTEAEDLVQETYLRALGAAGWPEASAPLKAWLFTILRRLWLNRLRHTRCGPEFISLDTEIGLPQRISDSSGDPQVIHLRLAEGEAVQAAIEQLASPHREVVVLRDLEGFSYKEIAEILDCPVGTVMSRLNRARTYLKQQLGEWKEKPPTLISPNQARK